MKLILEGQLGVEVLGSGSGGNAVLIHTAEGVLMVDAGFSGRELFRRMGESGVEKERLFGVLLTHEHNDHVKGLKGMASKIPLKVWANPLTTQYLSSRGLESVDWSEFHVGETFFIGALRVTAFSVPHDAYDPCGFLIQAWGKTVVILTDLGYCTDVVREMAAKSQVMVLESNYDDELLESDVKRPWATKQRIMARHGHLSNLQASQLLSALKGAPLQHVFLGHMSVDCNDPDQALGMAREGLCQASLNHVEVHLTHQTKSSDFVVI